MRKRTKSSSGFSVVELLLVVSIISILAAIAIPNFLNYTKKAQMASVKSNMHDAQVASETYATDSAGNYAVDSSSLGPYYTGGSNTLGGSSGTYPTNPMTGVKNEAPAPCSINKSIWIGVARTSSGAANFGGGPGQTAYSGIQDDVNGEATDSYAITGCDQNGNSILGPNGFMVLSNQ